MLSRFYSEGSITRTIFGLLFWDIIFASVPGAFETPYQSAPLDIADDAFYRARKDLIEARLRDIREGKAREILERVDGAQRERDTWCVGVRWDLFSRQDLAEIVEVSLLNWDEHAEGC
jgi:Fanconi-associated nuclease 1